MKYKTRRHSANEVEKAILKLIEDPPLTSSVDNTLWMTRRYDVRPKSLAYDIVFIFRALDDYKFYKCSAVYHKDSRTLDLLTSESTLLLYEVERCVNTENGYKYVEA